MLALLQGGGGPKTQPVRFASNGFILYVNLITGADGFIGSHLTEMDKKHYVNYVADSSVKMTA